jgi:hypothetical protein
MEPGGDRGAFSGAAALAVAIAVAVLALAMVGIGGGVAHPLVGGSTPLTQSRLAPSQG